MNRIGGWLRGATPKSSASPKSNAAQAALEDAIALEVAALEKAMASVSLILNDDIEAAEKQLGDGNSTFHSLGHSLCLFMRSVLGFERDNMIKASERLFQCESRAAEDIKKAQKEAAAAAAEAGTSTAGSRVYPPGSEFALIQAEAQLMSGIVSVLQENKIEAVKGFLKLRKAWFTLNSILQDEEKYMDSLKKARDNSASPSSSSPSEKKSAGTPSAAGDDKNDTDPDDTDLEFVDAGETREPGTKTPLTYEGHVAKDADLEGKASRLSLNGRANGDVKKAAGTTTTGPDAGVFTHPIDIFVHSGIGMAMGVLLLALSLVPPAYARWISLTGLQGDRGRGIHMLWRSTEYANLNGGVAALMLFAYVSAPIM